MLGVATGFDLGLERRDIGQALEGQQGVPVPHQIVRDRQHLGKHGVGVFGDADVVVLGLGHLVHSVQTYQQRHCEHTLLRLTIFRLQMATHHQVELLVGAAHFQIGLERHRVIALQQRVQKLVQADGAAFGKARVEVVALHHAGHGVLGRQLDHAASAQLVAPLAVVTNFGLGRVQHLGGLGVIRLGIDLDLLGRQRRTGGVAARRIANQGREVTDQKDYLMAQILQLAHLVEHHGVTQVDVGGRGVQTQLDAQRHTRGLGLGQLLDPFIFGQQFIDPTKSDFQRLVHSVGHGETCNSRLIHKGFSEGAVGRDRYTWRFGVATNSRLLPHKDLFGWTYGTVELLESCQS